MSNQATLTKAEALQLNPVTLAFLGDAVYSLWVRRNLALTGGNRVSELQKSATALESARGQSELLDKILPLFTEEEEEIFRRGRNAKKATKSKHASVGEYNRSTGLEAVIGFLHITGDTARIDALLSVIDKESLLPQKNPTAYKP